MVEQDFFVSTTPDFITVASLPEDYCPLKFAYQFRFFSSDFRMRRIITVIN